MYPYNRHSLLFETKMKTADGNHVIKPSARPTDSTALNQPGRADHQLFPDSEA
jgi:hypothetical protein